MMQSNDYLVQKLQQLREDEQRSRAHNNQALLDIMNEFMYQRRRPQQRRRTRR